MADEKDIIEEINVLRHEINQGRNFGIDCSVKIKEERDLEYKLIEIRSIKLNNEFISTHKWNNTHTHTVRLWDVLNYKNKVCKVLELGTTSFDEVGDTFNYAARLKGIFIGEEFRIDFSYYDTIDKLVAE